MGGWIRRGWISRSWGVPTFGPEVWGELSENYRYRIALPEELFSITERSVGISAENLSFFLDTDSLLNSLFLLGFAHSRIFRLFRVFRRFRFSRVQIRNSGFSVFSASSAFSGFQGSKSGVPGFLFFFCF